MNATDDLRYPPGRLVPDYLRAAAGLSLTLGPLLFVETHPAVFWILAAMAALFAAFLLRTLERHVTRVRLDETGIAVAGPLPRAIRWSELSDFKLAYYSTRRDREQGWMQLKLAGGGRTLTVESALDGFEAVTERALTAARHNGVAVGDTTQENLSALGLIAEPKPADPLLARDPAADAPMTDGRALPR